MKIRLFEPNDLNAIIDLFIETVHEVNQRFHCFQFYDRLPLLSAG
ncbi:hypothetical protein [Metabacillus idriensis]|nr:hypothetical protein [Metabacillus idriensis]